MSLLAKVGTFQKTAGAAPATQAITGIGFTPKAIIIYATAATALDSWTTPLKFSIGFAADNGTQYANGFAAEHGAASNNASTRTAAKAITIIDPGETLLAEASITSFDADGFTLSWTTNNATQYQIAYIALGGTAITNAYAGTLTLPAVNQILTVTAPNFQPSAIFFSPTAYGGVLPITNALIQGGLGFWASGAGQYSIGFSHHDAGGASQYSILFREGPLNIAGIGYESANTYARPLTPIPTGFSIPFPNTNQGALSIYLALAGPTVQAFDIAKPNSPNPSTRVIQFGFTPKLLIAHSALIQDGLYYHAAFRHFLAATDGTNTAAAANVAHFDAGATIARSALTTASLLPLTYNTDGTESDPVTIDRLNPPSTLTFSPCSQNSGHLYLLAFGDEAISLAPNQSITFPMYDAATGKTPTTGLTVAAQRSSDGAAFTDCDNPVSEISDGFYRLELTDNDRSGTAILFKFTATGALTQSAEILNTP